MNALTGFARFLGAAPAPDAGEQPRRPSVPLPLAFGLALWFGCALVWGPAQNLSLTACTVLGAALLLTCTFLAAALVKLRKFLALCVAAGLLAGCALACAGGAQLHGVEESLVMGYRGACSITLLEDASATDFGPAATVAVETEEGRTVRVQAYFHEGQPLARYGDAFWATVELEAVSAPSSAWQWASGIVATARISDAHRIPLDGVRAVLLDVRNAAIDALDGDDEASAVLQALICGYCGEYDQTVVKQDFTACGLAHIVAVSGAHLAVVSAFVASVLRALRCPRSAQIALQCALMCAYLVITGMPVSALRAFAMVLAVQLSYFARRRGAGLSALGACVCAMVALDPSVAVSASFALSALSTLGIALFGGLASCWIASLLPRMPHVLAEALALTFASSILALPYSCALFSQLPLASPLANVVVAPLVAPVCTVGIVGAVLVLPATGVAQALFGAAHAGCQILCGAASVCAALPGASVPVAFPIEGALAATAVLASLLWWRWPLPSKKVRLRHAIVGIASAFTLAFCSMALASMLRGSQLVMLDVGQGDAFLARSGDAAVLIDTGTNDALLRQALARQGVFRLDAVIITHSDDDHCGSLPALGQCVQLDRVIVADDALECPCDSCADLREDAWRLVGKEGVVGVQEGDALSVGSMELEVVWPFEYQEEGGNADSLCLLLEQGEGGQRVRALLTGDAEAEQLDAIFKEVDPATIDILKVGHHGSKNAMTHEQAQQLSPALALVSVGEGNRYGHPHPDVMDALADAGARVYRTDLQGDVSCSFTTEGVRVSSLR